MGSKDSVQQNLPCIEQIIIHAIEFLDVQQTNIDSIERENNLEIPCPRLAGATFTSDGRLIYFRNFSFESNKQSLPHTYDGLLQFINRPISLEEAQHIPNA